MIEFKDLQSDDENIKKELELLQALNPIYLRTEELRKTLSLRIQIVSHLIELPLT